MKLKEVIVSYCEEQPRVNETGILFERFCRLSQSVTKFENMSLCVFAFLRRYSNMID